MEREKFEAQSDIKGNFTKETILVIHELICTLMGMGSVEKQYVLACMTITYLQRKGSIAMMDSIFSLLIVPSPK